MVAPISILFFHVFIPAATIEHFSKVQNPTKIPLFPFKTKVPTGAAFYLVQGHPELSKTDIGKHALGLTELDQDQAVEHLPIIHEHLSPTKFHPATQRLLFGKPLALGGGERHLSKERGDTCEWFFSSTRRVSLRETRALRRSRANTARFGHASRRAP